MNYRAICQKIIETNELIELAKEHNLERDLENLKAKKEFYIQKLARLN